MRNAFLCDKSKSERVLCFVSTGHKIPPTDYGLQYTVTVSGWS